jgi:hypothetical protein
MPRQPFLPIYKDADLMYGPAHIKKKPEIAAAVGRCIMLWSYVDWQMALLLAAIMKADSETSIAIFLTLRNARAQRDVLLAAADMTLSGQTREIFDAVMLLYGSLQLQRADIAHGIFGHIDIDDDTIVPWIEAKKLSKDFIDKFHRPRDPDGPAAGADTRAVQKRETSIYKISDLEQLAKEINELWGIAFSFTSSLRWPGSEHAIKTLEVQCKVPQMQQALSQIRKRNQAADT